MATILSTPPTDGRRWIDLDGPDGNAFFIMANARQWGEQLDLDTDAILADMRSSDYQHLLDVFERHFGNLCALVSDRIVEGEE